MVFQAFSIGSNVWLSAWSNDNEIVVNGTTDKNKRDMYLGVYGALGIGQGKIIISVSECCMYAVMRIFINNLQSFKNNVLSLAYFTYKVDQTYIFL